MIRKFAKYYKPHLRLFTLDMVCAFIVACCDLFYPVIAKNIINDYVPNQNIHLFVVWAIVLLCIYVLKAFLNYIIQYWGHIVGVRIQGDMRRELFRHLQKLPFSFFDENKTGVIMSRMINDLFEVSELAHHGPENLFLSLIILIGAFIMLAQISLPLTLITFAVLPFMIFFAFKTRTMMNKAFSETRVKTAEINANVETAIAGIRVSKAYTADEHENQKFNVANENLKRSRSGAYKAMGIFHSGMTLFMDLLYLVVLSSGGLFFFYGKINAGEFAAFLLYISMFLNPVNKLVSFYEQLQEGMTGFRRFCEIMAIDEEESDSTDLLHPDHLDGNICFENVTFSYENSDKEGEAPPVIKNLTMDIKKGCTLALVGPSGSGKTTMCHLIPRFYDVDSGRITIDGIDITKISRYDLRKNIGMVAQDVFLFNGTIRENIAYGNLDATDEEIIEAAKKANIHDYILTMEDGYDTQVGERGIKLSGGQKQRISIARVFLKNPPILILDEATSALDNATEMLIQKSLEELGRGRTSVIVAHRLSTIKSADEIIVLTANGITERGSHDELVAAGGMYAELYQYQFRE
ncbi:ABC transporter ATP-binding protein [Emergencia sp. 1XD21-10]|jgi:ATP-binding cassette subfamily B protein|uniref:ABC transporter ATP-binding protein n=1 Tax=Emergencia sp. 1XD21-10 TaxID=2304569 RepID=UPI001379ABD7|nr:ABC transporter ATP-binding protein [Emergencia sp. 1XD21-10]NCE98060.1 ABC transporter ATP-binding protein [Emergencia sp. 1XD21-10]